MNQKEFEDRTQVKVSFQEYQAIEIVYMECDLDKDEFCKMWCQMNASRVKKAQDEAKAKEEEECLRRTLIEMMDRMHAKMRELRGDFTIAPLTVNFLSETEQDLLEKVGISLRISIQQAIDCGYPFPRFYNIDETEYHIRKYLNIA